MVYDTRRTAVLQAAIWTVLSERLGSLLLDMPQEIGLGYVASRCILFYPGLAAKEVPSCLPSEDSLCSGVTYETYGTCSHLNMRSWY